MIGPALFVISYEIYLTMLGFIWMLADSVYHFIRPLKRSSENASPKGTEKYDENEQFVLKSNELVNKKSQENIIENKLGLRFSHVTSEDEGLGVNAYTNTLSGKQIFFEATNASIDRRLLPKRPHEIEFDVPTESLDDNYQNALNLMVVKNTFNNKHELEKNLLFAIQEITKFIKRSTTIVDGKPTSLVPLSRDANRGHISLSFSVLHSQVSIDIQRKRLNWYSFISSEPTHVKWIKLNSDQILALQEIALYIIKYLDIGVKSQFRKKNYGLKTLDVYGANCNYSSSKNNHTDFENTSNVKITEIDSGDEIELTRNPKNQRKRKNKKRYRKLVNHKIEPNSITFSSKQCFERLVCFMNTNQGLTQSKMMLEIEKEFKPIKDQISELRESMTDFVIVSQITYEKGIRSSKLSVKPIVRRNQKLRSIFTVSSASLQRLARLADTSTNNQESSYQEGAHNEPKKLSPLAEMYIKLSRQ